MTEKDNLHEEENNINKDKKNETPEIKEGSNPPEAAGNEGSESDESSKGSSSNPPSSNYQISLINENLLKIRLTTSREVKIDCFAKDKDSGKKSQSNSINIHPKGTAESQEIEVIIEIDAEGNVIPPEKKKTESEPLAGLIPNPEVANLINRDEGNIYGQEHVPLTPEQELQEKINSGNPFIKFRGFYQRNLTVGIIIAIALHLFAVTAYFANAKKKGDVSPDDVQRRLIVIQDLPEPQINLTEVEDPNPPPEEVKEDETTIPRVTPRNITRPPRVTRPRTTTDAQPTDTTSVEDLNRELDSLRKLASGDTTAAGDTSRISGYVIPDSLRTTFSENEVGLNMYFPQNWKLIDSREIDQNKKEFVGVILVDTTAEEQGTMNLFINLDPQGLDYKREQFTAEFTVDDTTLTAFYREPFVEGAFMKYHFYIFNDIGTEKLSVKADVRKQHFEDYKMNIEAVVRSIRIRKPTSFN